MAGAEPRAPRRARPFAAVAILLLLAACASIPLPTLWKLRAFDRSTLLQLQPADVRVVTTLEPAASIDPGSVRLTLALSRDGDVVQSHAFALEAPPARLPSDPAGQIWRLDAAGRTAFGDLQHALRAAEAGGDPTFDGATFAVNFKPDFEGTAPDALRLTVRMLLRPADGWFTLVDRHSIPVTPGP